MPLPTFVELDITKAFVTDGNLAETLEALMPSTVQILNLLHIKRSELFSPVNVESIRFFSYETITALDNSMNGNMMEISGRDWGDKSRPLFLVCVLSSKYNIHYQECFKWRLMYSRETPDITDAELIKEFSLLFGFSENAKTPMFFADVESKFVPFMEKVAAFNERISTIMPNMVMYLPHGKLLDETIVSGFSTRSLKPDESFIIMSHWKHATTQHSTLIQDQIMHSCSVGVYVDNERSVSSKSEANAEIVSKVITLPYGPIAALETKDPYKRKGLAEMAVGVISGKLRQHGLYPVAGVEVEDVVSRRLLDKLGYRKAFKSCWIILAKPD